MPAEAMPAAPGAGRLVLAKDLRKVYRIGGSEVAALDGLDLAIGAGEFVAVVGVSGSGKSTLLNLLGGLDRPTSGSIEVDGRPLEARTEPELARYRRRTVGMVFQAFHLLPALTALENVALPLAFAGVPRRERDGRARQALERVGLAGRIGHRPPELSAGEQQRAAVARALVNRPRILLADEPTGNLDRRNSEEIMGLLAAANREGAAIVLVTHNESQAREYCRRLVRLDFGRLAADEALR